MYLPKTILHNAGWGLVNGPEILSKINVRKITKSNI